jgi:(R,R)-butanediol dehydrogenase/meso-butanediol dehydrogenase/diacetyl reductase
VHEFTHGPIATSVEPHALTGATNPQIFGHEFCAEVLEVGERVTNVRTDRRVSAMPLLFCGTCPYCRLGQNHLCQRMGCTGLIHAWGGLAEAAIVSASQLAVPPDELDDMQCAMIELIAVASYRVDRAGVAPGTSVLVTGGGRSES